MEKLTVVFQQKGRHLLHLIMGNSWDFERLFDGGGRVEFKCVMTKFSSSKVLHDTHKARDATRYNTAQNRRKEGEPVFFSTFIQKQESGERCIRNRSQWRGALKFTQKLNYK
jgi:hypothetical protein